MASDVRFVDDYEMVVGSVSSYLGACVPANLVKSEFAAHIVQYIKLSFNCIPYIYCGT